MSQGSINDGIDDEYSDPEFERLLEAVERQLQPKVAAINGDDEEVLEANKRYIGSHESLPNDYQKLSKEELVNLGKELLDRTASLRRKESVLMILAHNGCWEALGPLEDYVRNPDPELRMIAELAFEECRFWFDEDPYGRDPDEQVFMGFDPEKPCPCGSGRLFRECHGTLPYGPPTCQPKKGPCRPPTA